MSDIPGGTYTISGPPVIAIGWIPRHYRLPASMSLGVLGGRLWASMHAVYMLGNEPPVNIISHIDQLKKYLSNRDFRGAVWLFDVQLTLDNNDRAINIDCNDDHDVGYTPYLSFIPIKRSRRMSLVSERFNSPGEGDGQLVRTTSGNCGKLTRTVWFRLGKGANCISRVLSGNWAPYASMKIEYEIDSNGRGSVTFNGSYIPSQSYYFKGVNTWRHDIYTNTVPQTKGFLLAGAAQHAPTRVTPVKGTF